MIDLPLPQTLEEFVESSRRYFEPAPVPGVWIDGDDPPAAPPMLVKRLLQRNGLSFLGGQSGAGKSFAALDLSVAIASGGEFFGHEVAERGAVIYLAGEGASTIAPRLAAAKKARGVKGNLPIAVIAAVPDLSDDRARREFIETLHRVAARLKFKHDVGVALVVVDTIAACFSVKDENAAGEMGQVCRAVRELGDAIGAATLAVAHYGKSSETGLRGSSALRAAAESVLAVLADRDETTGKCSNRRLVHSKSRVGAEGPISAFELRDITIGTGDDGEPATAGYIFVTDDAPDEAPPKKKRGEQSDVLAKAFRDAYERLADGVEKTTGFDGAPVRKVAADAIRDELRRRGFLDTDDAGRICQSSRQRLRRAKDALLTKCGFVESDGMIWRTSAPAPEWIEP